MSAANSRNILITGASGMIGKALTSSLEQQGYTVYPLVRGRALGPFYYLQDQGQVVLDPNTPLFAVINLAGANIAAKRWNEKRKRVIVDSREKTTRHLCDALKLRTQKPAVLISASAIGFYGSNPAGAVDESAAPGNDFMAEVATKWESATNCLAETGIRSAHLRFGIVLSTKGGVLQNFILPLNIAVVGAVGDGKQIISWVSITDALRFISYALENEKVSGPVNLVAPNPVSSLEFAKTLSSVSKRLRLPTLPAPVARLMFGEMADAALLASANIKSSRLDEFGFSITHPSLHSALSDVLQHSL